MTEPRVKYGTLTEIEVTTRRQRVQADDGEVLWLTPGWDAAVGARVGDRIRLEYVATPSRALWYGAIAYSEEVVEVARAWDQEEAMIRAAGEAKAPVFPKAAEGSAEDIRNALQILENVTRLGDEDDELDYMHALALLRRAVKKLETT